MSDTIIYFKNGIGNLILQSPAAIALASMDKTGKVDFCLSSEWNDIRVEGIRNILEHSPHVNTVYSFPGNNIPEHKLYFYTMHSENSNALEYFRRKGKLIEVRTNWYDTLMHETYYYMNMVRKIGFNGPTPKQFVPVSDNYNLEKTDKKRIGICNGYFHTDYWKKKKYPFFTELIKTLNLILSGEVEFYLIGISGELEKQKNIQDINIIDYTGKLSFIETAKIISQMDIFITTDTSNMHVADSLNVNTIALFGSTFIFKNAPLNGSTEVLYSNIECRPCQSKQDFFDCKKNSCMFNINVGDIINRIQRKKWVI